MNNIFVNCFFIAEKSWTKCPVGFNCAQINKQFTLYYHNSCNLIQNEQGNCFVLGIVEEGDELKKPLIEQIDDANLLTLPQKLTETWIGGFVLVTKNYLITDVWGQQTIYFKCKTQSPFIFSSTPELLNWLLGNKAVEIDIGRNFNFEYDIQALKPECLFNLNTLKLQQYIKYDNHVVEKFDIDYFHKLILTAFQRLEKTGHFFVIPLTGGRDSRLSLSVALKACLKDISTFTFVKPFYYSDAADILTPFIISKFFKVPHKFIFKSQFSPDTLKYSKFHTNFTIEGNKPGGFHYYQSYGYYNKLGTTNNGKVIVSSLYYDLIEATYAKGKATAAYLNASGFNITEHTLDEMYKRLVSIFPDCSISKLSLQGTIYWAVKQIVLNRTISSQAQTGFNVFCPGVCQYSFKNSVNLCINKQTNAFVHKSIISKYSRMLAHLPYKLPIRSINYYIQGFLKFIKLIAYKYGQI